METIIKSNPTTAADFQAIVDAHAESDATGSQAAPGATIDVKLVKSASNKSETTRNAALSLASNGIPAFPCKPDKSPRTQHGFKDATTDSKIINKYWKTHPDSLVATPTGEASGFFVVDVDNKKGKDGSAALKELESINGELPETRTIATPSGGFHIYFNWPNQKVKTSVDELGLGLDVRGDGGYVIAPPSKINGVAYTFIKPESTDIANSPQWLIDKVCSEINEVSDTKKLSAAVPSALQGLTVESLGLLNRDKFEHNELKIYSALEATDCSSLDHNNWLQSGMALYHSSGGAGVAFDMWDRWSSKDKARYDADEMRRKWDGFAGYSGDTVGLGTLFKICEYNGWDGQLVQDKTAIKLAVNERRQAFDEMSKYHGVCMVEGKTAIVRRIVGKRGIDNQLMSVSSAREFYSNKYVVNTNAAGGGSTQSTTAIEKKPIFPQWMCREDRRTYERVVFEPVGGLIAKDTVLPNGNAFNLYTGLARVPVHMPKSEYSLIIRHILDVWCCGDKEAFKYVLLWFANMLQNPHRQGGTVLLLHSDEGAGKNIITDIFMRAFGSASVQVTNSNDVAGRFNDHLAICVFVVFNEATWGGDKAAQGTLKSLITDDVLLVERKNVPKFMVDNCVHLIINTNNDYPAPVGLNDRRFVFLDLDERYMGDKEYFRKLGQQTTGKGQDGFIDYLLNLNIDGFNPTNMPEVLNRGSATKLEGKVRTSGSTLQWWYEILSEGDFNSGGSSILIDSASGYTTKNGPDWETTPVEVCTNGLFRLYGSWCRDHHKYPDAKDVWAKNLRKYIDGLRKARPTVMNRRTYSLIIPPLPDCRNWLENEILKQDIEWE